MLVVCGIDCFVYILDGCVGDVLECLLKVCDLMCLFVFLVYDMIFEN